MKNRLMRAHRYMNPYKSYTDQNLIWNINFNRKFFRIKQPSLKKVAMSKYPQESVELYYTTTIGIKTNSLIFQY
mgnify:CR=1 FL=1